MKNGTSGEREDFHLVHPEHYAMRGYPHAIWARLRREDPVHWFDRTPGQPFWAITKHADICAVARRPQIFVSGPVMVLSHVPMESIETPRTLNRLDPPEHGAYRALVAKLFTRHHLRSRQARIDLICRQFVDRLLETRGNSAFGECEFVGQLAGPLTNAVVSWFLGAPESDWNLLLDLTDRSIGIAEPHNRQPGVAPPDAFAAVIQELFAYYTQLADTKRRNPGDDLVSLLVGLKRKRTPIPPSELFRYFFLMTWAAANEAVRSCLAGALIAFIEWSRERRRLVENPQLMRSAVEEVLRWTSPIIHFARTATRDCELRGKQIKAGDTLALFFPSANRDEDVFDAADKFSIDRDPNDHLSFGAGEHFCLGSHVARMVLTSVYGYLLPRIDDIEVDGKIERTHSNWSGGFQRVPVRYKLVA